MDHHVRPLDLQVALAFASTSGGALWTVPRRQCRLPPETLGEGRGVRMMLRDGAAVGYEGIRGLGGKNENNILPTWGGISSSNFH